MKIFDILMGRKRVRDAYMGDGSSFISRWARPPSRNTAEWLEMYSKSPRLAVVEKIATDLASLEGHLLRINPDGSETELTRHPFLDFMAHPNPLYEMTSSALWRLNEIYLMLVGESFFLIERDENDRPVELWSVPPHWVKMTPYLGNPGYMITSPSGLTMTVPVDDMFVMKRLNPLDPFMRGLGVAESIADEIEIDEFSAQFQKRFFYNDGTPSMVFLMPDASEQQRDAFMARWNKRHRGVENSHKAAALTGKVSIETFGSKDIRELGFVESRVAMRDAVLEHFGVPREIMGITENSNRSTADSAQYIYAKNVLTPRIRDREEAINQQLLPLFGENLVWRFDPVVPYDKEFDKARALDGWNAGLLTKNEARGLMDLPDVQGGDVFKVGFNDLFMEQTADPAEVSQSLGEKKARQVNVEAMLRKEDAALRENEQRFESVVTKHFADQRSAVAKALGMTAKAETDVLAALDDLLLPDGVFDPMLWEALKEEERLRLAEAVADGLLNWKDEIKKLTTLLTPLWKQAYDDGAKAAAESYSFTDLARPEFVSQARVNGGKRIVGIQATTRKNIADIIARGVENGSSQNELKKEVLTAMGPGTTKARAKLIARQETMMSLATGQFDTMKAAGATTKTWHHRAQKDPRDGTNGKVDHVSMEGETVPIDKPFSNGLMYPQDPNDGRPEQVINCRCYLTYGFEEEAGADSAPALTEPPEEAIIGAGSAPEETPPIDAISAPVDVAQEHLDATELVVYRRFETGDAVNGFFYYDGEDRGALQKVRSEHGRWIKSLSKDEEQAIRSYTANGYSNINRYWRRGSGWESIPADSVEEASRQIDAAISRFHLKESITVQRGLDDFYGGSLIESIEWNDIHEIVGMTYQDLGYGSSTALMGNRVATAKPYLLEIDIPAGIGCGAYVNKLSGQFEDKEFEFLIARGSKFEITDVVINKEPIPPQTIIRMRMIVNE